MLRVDENELLSGDDISLSTNIYNMFLDNEKTEAKSLLTGWAENITLDPELKIRVEKIIKKRSKGHKTIKQENERTYEKKRNYLPKAFKKPGSIERSMEIVKNYKLDKKIESIVEKGNPCIVKEKNRIVKSQIMIRWRKIVTEMKYRMMTQQNIINFRTSLIIWKCWIKKLLEKRVVREQEIAMRKKKREIIDEHKAIRIARITTMWRYFRKLRRAFRLKSS